MCVPPTWPSPKLWWWQFCGRVGGAQSDGQHRGAAHRDGRVDGGDGKCVGCGGCPQSRRRAPSRSMRARRRLLVCWWADTPRRQVPRRPGHNCDTGVEQFADVCAVTVDYLQVRTPAYLDPE